MTRATTLAALLVFALVPRPARAEEKIVRVYNWADYIADDTLSGFEKATGIKVVYETFTSNEEVQEKLVAGQGGYDVVIPSSMWGKQQAAEGLLRPIEKSRVTNLRNLDPQLQGRLARLDPGNRYLVPWLWGFTTVGIDVARVKKALGGLPMPENAWDLLFKKAYVSRLRSCGVSVLDSPTELVPMVLHYLGRPPHSGAIEDYAGVQQLLLEIRPYVTRFGVDYIDDLAAGKVCLVLGYSGDINVAKRRARERKTGRDIQALLPSTGAVLFVDTMAIPKKAPHPENAHRFIDYVLRPEVHAGLTNKIFYANPNASSMPFVNPEVAREPTVFPPPAELDRMVMPDVLSDEARRLMSRIFAKFKAGR
ncbi:MAG: extracellular solute-binding protein [Anaeromyxobacteraceae bacterium]